MPIVHNKYTSNGREFDITETGQKIYKAFSGQKNVNLGNNVFAPYVWDEPSQSIRYGDLSCEFYSGGYQVVRGFGSVETLIDDQRFEVQYLRGNWRTLDLWPVGLTVDQQEDYCIVTRNLSDGEGNTLDIDFLFKPMEKVKLTFRLHVVDANLYRIRFQNTGIAGEVTEVPLIDRKTQANLGVSKLLFENIKFEWNADEIGIHEGYIVEDQAGGKKLDFFLGDFDLLADGDVVVSPTTWGPTTTSDDCYVWDDEVFDDYEGSLYVGYETSVEHIGFTFSTVAIPAGATIGTGTKITVTADYLDGTQTDCLLKVCDSRDVGAWGEPTQNPADQAVHSTTVAWNLNESSGSHDSPELKTPVQERFNGDVAAAHVENDPISVVWISTASSGPGDQGITADNATLTIVYTAAGSTVTVTTSLDALIKKTISENLSVDALLQKSIPITLSIDALLTALQTISGDLDAQLFKSDGKALSIDALLQKLGVSSASVDALLTSLETVSGDLDAQLFKTYTKTLSIDGLLQRLGVTTSLSIDALLRKTGTKDVSLDAILYTLGAGLETLSIDALLNKSNVISQLNIDALLAKPADESLVIDAVLLKTLTNSLVFDAYLQKQSISTLALDAHISKLETLSTGMDAILLGGGTIVEASLDALLQKLQLQTASLDALLYSGQIRTASLDAIVRGTLTATIDFDALLQKEGQASTLMDAIIFSALIVATPKYDFISSLIKPDFIDTQVSPDFISSLVKPDFVYSV